MNKMKKGLGITTPTGKMTLQYANSTLPMFFHKGMVANLRADERAITCREALVLELHRQYMHRVGNNHNRIYLIHLTGTFKAGFTTARITEFIRDFVHKRDGRAALLDTAIKVEINSRGGGQIVFPVLDTYAGDALTSPAMLVWLLRNGQGHILNTRNNYDSLNGVFNRFKSSVKKSKVTYENSQNLLMWLAFFLTPDGNNRQVMAINGNGMTGQERANGPSTLMSRFNLDATMQNILHSNGAIERLARMTDNFDKKLIGSFTQYAKLVPYKKYLK